MAADLFLVDLDRLELVGAQFDPLSMLATVGLKGPVDYTIVAGVPVVQNGVLTTVDEEAVARQGQRGGPALSAPVTVQNGAPPCRIAVFLVVLPLVKLGVRTIIMSTE